MDFEQTRYRALINQVKTREKEVRSFLAFLQEKTSWLTSPASTRFHNNFEQGLLRHSILVSELLLQLKEIWSPDINNESCVICGLFHDVGKVGLPGKPLYLPNPEGRSKCGEKKYTINPDLVYLGLGVRSLLLVNKFIPLSEDEAQAIAYHDGQYIEENKQIAHREEPMTLLLSYADNWAGEVLEKGG
ncbi:MAG TPA: HD domain-containing protein [Thermodesulfobacteriota bacterium]|nr:HD domain-containing protein [Thermodesulfobacteriota bacterium]